MAHVTFSSILELNFAAKVFKKYVFCKMKIVTLHQGGEGGPSQCHQMIHGGGGLKIGQKSVAYYLNDP